MLKMLVAKAINSGAYKNFVEGTQNPQLSYQLLEKEILALYARGSFWKEQIGRFDSINDFPITDYEFYRATIERTLSQKVSPFTNDDIHFWCTSSGTSAAPKLFPLSTTYTKQLLRISSTYTYFLAKALGRSIGQPLIFFPSTASNRFSPAGIEIGFISRFMFLRQPKIIRRGYALPAEVFESDALLKEWGPLYGLSTDICAIMGTVPSLISTFCDQIDGRKDELFNILSGSKPWPKGLPPRKVSKARLKVIEQAFARSPFVMKELWPHLGLLITWKGSTAGLQVPLVEKYNQGQAKYCDGLYSATEGWVTVSTLENTDVGCPMHMNSTFAEFIEEGNAIVTGNLQKPWELEVGKRYEIFMSQAMGFARYRLRDVVLCKGFYGKSPILEFLYKEGNIVSLGQTRFNEMDILAAIKQTGFTHPFEWTIAPASDGLGMIFHTTHVAPTLAKRVNEMDNLLARLNPEIIADYEMGLLRPMEVKLLDTNHPFWLAGRHGQGKMRILTRNPLT